MQQFLRKLVRYSGNRVGPVQEWIWMGVRREPKRHGGVWGGRFPLVGAWFNSHPSALEAVDS